jgi:hypothetical protein
MEYRCYSFCLLLLSDCFEALTTCWCCGYTPIGQIDENNTIVNRGRIKVVVVHDNHGNGKPQNREI